MARGQFLSGIAVDVPASLGHGNSVTAIPSAHARTPEERRHLWIALTASVGAHVVAASVWALLGTFLIALNRSLLAEMTTTAMEARMRARQEPPLVYVDVSPEQAAPEPPPETKFYSTQNTLAANPEPVDKDSDIPKIEGREEPVTKTFDTLRPAPVSEPTPPPEPEPEPETKPTPAQPGDLALGTPPQETRRRPRTLAEARMQKGLVGPRTRQDGGVRRQGVVSLNVKSSPFGAYDAALVAAIQKRWYDLLEDTSVPLRPGRVVVEFTLHYDGRITELKIAEQDVGEILSLYCRKAISDPAPFSPWPKELRQLVGKDYRDVRISFFYL